MKRASKLPSNAGNPSSHQTSTQPVTGRALDHPHRVASAPSRVDQLMQLGPAFTQQLAWHTAPPTYRGKNAQRARSIGRELRQLALVNRQFSNDLKVFLSMARWSHELALLRSDLRASSDRLVADPMSADIGPVLPQVMPTAAGRLETLLRATTESVPSDSKRKLLKALFVAYIARFDSAATAQSQALHLPLDHLPLRVMASDPVFNPSLLHLDLVTPFFTRQYAPLYALTVCLPRFEARLQFMVMLQIVLASEHWPVGIANHVIRFMRSLGRDVEATHRRALQWKEGFLEAPAEQIADELAREVLNALVDTPVLGTDVCLRALIRFCSEDPLRAIATDETLVALIHRVMDEIGADPSTVAQMQFEQLCSEIPEELRVSAFKRLSAQQRLAIVEQHHGHAINPFMVAVVEAGDIPLARCRAVLEDMIECLEDDDPDHGALPALRALRTDMDHHQASG